MVRSSRRALALALAAALAACGDGPQDPQPAGSFARIQSRILDERCTSCHTSGAAFARESGLVLTAGASYAALVGATPTNAAARAAGLMRVVPSSPDRSLLWHKLQWASGHHAPDYGSPMPLGGPPLTVGEMTFIRRWIEAGAPESGEVADPALLDDRTPQSVAPFVALAPPPHGYQLRVDPFQVAPSFEREIFVYRRIGNAEPAWVTRVETAMRPGSHHLLVQTFEAGTPDHVVPAHDAVRDIRAPYEPGKCADRSGCEIPANMVQMGYHVFFSGAMTQTSDYRFPDGVALRIPARASLDLNAHYANRGVAPITGEAFVNLHTIDSAAVRDVALPLDLGNSEIRLPARRRTTLTKEFRVGGRGLPVNRDGVLRLLMLTSHVHERGERFVIRHRDLAGATTVLYENTAWASPLIRTFSPALVVREGESLISEITWNNTTDRVITFGLQSTDEMGIIFGYYY